MLRSTITVIAALALGACAIRPQVQSLPRLYYCGSAHVANRPDALALNGSGAPAGSESCAAADQYDAVLIRYMRAGNTAALATELAIDESEARQLIRDAMQRLNRRFWHR